MLANVVAGPNVRLRRRKHLVAAPAKHVTAERGPGLPSPLEAPAAALFLDAELPLQLAASEDAQAIGRADVDDDVRGASIGDVTAERLEEAVALDAMTVREPRFLQRGEVRGRRCDGHGAAKIGERLRRVPDLAMRPSELGEHLGIVGRRLLRARQHLEGVVITPERDQRSAKTDESRNVDCALEDDGSIHRLRLVVLSGLVMKTRDPEARLDVTGTRLDDPAECVERFAAVSAGGEHGGLGMRGKRGRGLGRLRSRDCLGRGAQQTAQDDRQQHFIAFVGLGARGR
jgi:hypothetical protein